MSVDSSRTQQGNNTVAEAMTNPTPRRLHFATPLTTAEDQETSAQAMNPSLEAGQHMSSPATALQPATRSASLAHAVQTLIDSSTQHRATGHDTQPHSPLQTLTNELQKELEDTIDVDYF